MNLRAPCARHRATSQDEAALATTQSVIGQRHAAMLDTIGTRHDQRHRHVRRLARAITDQRRQMYGLTRAIDTTLGVEIGIERA